MDISSYFPAQCSNSRLSKWRPSAILDLVWRESGQFATRVWWPWHCAKIARWSYLYFARSRVSYSARLALKLLVRAHFGRIFLGAITKNESRYCRNPQKDRHLAKSRHISHIPWKSFYGFDLGAWPRKKIGYNHLTRKKVTKPTYFTCLGRSPRNGLKWGFALM